MLSRTLTTHRIAGEGIGPFLFHTTTSTLSRLFRYLQLCMWDDYHILQLQRLYLPDCYSMSFTNLWNYCLIGWWCEISFCLLDDLILVFCYSNFDMGNRWTQTRINYILVLYVVCMYYKWFTWIIRCNFWDNSKTPLYYIFKLGQAIHH